MSAMTPEELRETIARTLYLTEARRHAHPDDFDSPEGRWDNGKVIFKDLWLAQADLLVAVVSPLLATTWDEGQRAEANAAHHTNWPDEHREMVRTNPYREEPHRG